MTRAALAHACRACGWLGLPARLWCPRCAGTEWDPVEEAFGAIRAITRLRRAVAKEIDPRDIVLVELDAGAWLIGVAETESMTLGDRVRVSRQGHAVVARHV